MMRISLERFSYARTEVEGVLSFENEGQTLMFPTIERPWVPNPNGVRGGEPWRSCVPDGVYTLSPWTRPNGDKVWILYAPELGVYRTADEHAPGHGRHLILIHAANWAHQVNGCIAPGLLRSAMPHKGVFKQAVSHSQRAMSDLRMWLGDDHHVLEIRNDTGAKDVRL